jgi:hypothetical protein
MADYPGRNGEMESGSVTCGMCGADMTHIVKHGRSLRVDQERGGNLFTWSGGDGSVLHDCRKPSAAYLRQRERE